MGFYNHTKDVTELSVEELCEAASDSFFRWVDSDGVEGSSCGNLPDYCDDEDVGDEYDVKRKLMLYYEWEYITREELEEFAQS